MVRAAQPTWARGCALPGNMVTHAAASPNAVSRLNLEPDQVIFLRDRYNSNATTMSRPEQRFRISSNDYLQGELGSDIRHEYINGHVYGMVGASDAHNLIAQNITFALRQHLHGGTCQVFISDMKARIRTQQDDVFYYPDVLVSCARDDRERYFREKAKLIVEVLSENTERADREGKFAFYRQLDTLDEYVLVAQDSRRVEIYRRNQKWEPEFYTGDARFELDSVNLLLTLDQVYEDVPLENEPAQST